MQLRILLYSSPGESDTEHELGSPKCGWNSELVSLNGCYSIYSLGEQPSMAEYKKDKGGVYVSTNFFRMKKQFPRDPPKFFHCVSLAQIK